MTASGIWVVVDCERADNGARAIPAATAATASAIRQPGLVVIRIPTPIRTRINSASRPDATMDKVDSKYKGRAPTAMRQAAEVS